MISYSATQAYASFHVLHICVLHMHVRPAGTLSMAEIWLWKLAKWSAVTGTDTSAPTSGLAEDPVAGIHAATNSEYMRLSCQALSCSHASGTGLPGMAISRACCQAVPWQRLKQALRLGTIVEAPLWGWLRHHRICVLSCFFSVQLLDAT